MHSHTWRLQLNPPYNKFLVGANAIPVVYVFVKCLSSSSIRTSSFIQRFLSLSVCDLSPLWKRFLALDILFMPSKRINVNGPPWHWFANLRTGRHQFTISQCKIIIIAQVIVSLCLSLSVIHFKWYALFLLWFTIVELYSLYSTDYFPSSINWLKCDVTIIENCLKLLQINSTCVLSNTCHMFDHSIYLIASTRTHYAFRFEPNQSLMADLG